MNQAVASLIHDKRYEKLFTISRGPFPWKEDRKQHRLHNICSRICSLPAGLARYFILNFSKEGEIVLDPFSGKGTVPLESVLNKRKSIGNDISPEAWILTAAKVTKINKYYLNAYIKKLEEKMGFLDKLHVDSNVKIFYHRETLRQLMELKQLLKKNTKYSRFVKAVLLGMLHGSNSTSLSLKCSHSYSMSPNYVKNYARKHRLIKPNKDVIECLKERISFLLEEGLPPESGISLMNDSRQLDIDDESINLIVTSPPYFAVQTYAYDNWLRLWFLGYDYKEVHKTQVNTNNEEKYAIFMKESLKEMYRVLKPNSFAFVVVGDIMKKTAKGDKLIKTAEFLKPLAEEVGFSVPIILLDEIPQSRKVLNCSLCGKGIKTERILCLHKN